MTTQLDWKPDAYDFSWYAQVVLSDGGNSGVYTLLPVSRELVSDIEEAQYKDLWQAVWRGMILCQNVGLSVAKAKCQSHYERMLKEITMSEQRSADLFYVITNTDGDVDLTVHTLESLLRFLNREDYDASDEEPEDHLALCVQPGEMPGVGEQMDLSAGFRVGYSSMGGWPRKGMLIIRGRVVAPEPVTEVTRWGVA